MDLILWFKQWKKVLCLGRSEESSNSERETLLSEVQWLLSILAGGKKKKNGGGGVNKNMLSHYGALFKNGMSDIAIKVGKFLRKFVMSDLSACPVSMKLHNSYGALAFSSFRMYQRKKQFCF